MENLLKALFIFGLILLMVSAIMWNSITGVVIWKVAVSFILIAIGVKTLWIK